MYKSEHRASIISKNSCICRALNMCKSQNYVNVLHELSHLVFDNPLKLSTSVIIIWSRGVKPIFTGGHISLAVAFKGPTIISTP